MEGYWNAADYQAQAMNAFAAMQERADRQRLRAQQEQAARAQAEAERQAQARQQQLHNDWSAAATAGTPDAWNGLFQKYPEQYKALRESMDAIGKDRKMAEVNNAMQMYAAPDLKAAEALARRRAAALRAAGNEQEARAIEENMSAFPDVGTLRATAASIIWGGAPPETAKAFFEANKQASQKDIYDTEEAKFKAQSAGIEAQQKQQALAQASSPFAQDIAERQKTLEMDKTEAETRKLQAEAEAAANKPVEAQLQQQKLEAEIKLARKKASEMSDPNIRFYNGILENSRTAQPLLDDAAALSAFYETKAGRPEPTGLSAAAIDRLKKIKGGEDPESFARNIYLAVGNAQNAVALEGQGAVSDYERKLAQAAIPAVDAPSEIKAAFVQKALNALRRAPIEAEAAARWVGAAEDKSGGFTVAGADAPDVGIKKGMTWPSYLESRVKAMGVGPIDIESAGKERTNVMPNPRPQGGLTPGQRIQMLKERAQKGR